jgi:putative flippase GtrA
MRFLTVAVLAYLANVGVLAALVTAGAGKIVAQALAIVLVTPLNFVGNKLWSFR